MSVGRKAFIDGMDKYLGLELCNLHHTDVTQNRTKDIRGQPKDFKKDRSVVGYDDDNAARLERTSLSYGRGTWIFVVKRSNE